MVERRKYPAAVARYYANALKTTRSTMVYAWQVDRLLRRRWQIVAESARLRSKSGITSGASYLYRSRTTSIDALRAVSLLSQIAPAKARIIRIKRIKPSPPLG